MTKTPRIWKRHGWQWGRVEGWPDDCRSYGYDGEKWTCHFWYTDWSLIAFGISIDLKSPNIEIHLPMGFIRAGINSSWREETYGVGEA